MNAEQFQQMLTAFNNSNLAMAQTISASMAETIKAAIGKIQPSMSTSITQVNSNLNIIANFDFFNPGKEKFDQYQSQFENFLKLKKVFADKIKCAQLFLNSIGPALCDLLTSLAAPRNIYELQYSELTCLLSNHYPKNNELIE